MVLALACCVVFVVTLAADCEVAEVELDFCEVAADVLRLSELLVRCDVLLLMETLLLFDTLVEVLSELLADTDVDCEAVVELD